MNTESIDCQRGQCWLEGSTPSGFEGTASEEVRERWPDSVTVQRQGGVFFCIPNADVKAAFTLRSFDNLSVLVFREDNFTFAKTKEECKTQITNLIDSDLCDWQTAFQCWAQCGGVAQSDPRDMSPILAQACENLVKYRTTKASGNPTKTLFGKGSRDTTLVFRATCYRSGSGHCFASEELQYALGMVLQDAFGFVVDLEDYDLDIKLRVWFNRVTIAIPLTRESLHKRNIVDVGYTTLRATICHGMLRLARVTPGDVVCDPMCGSGAVIAESLGTHDSKGIQHLYLGGDCHPKAVEKCDTNNTAVAGRGGCDTLAWDVTHLPFREGTVDVFVTDLPFGKRMSNVVDNRVLYADALRELARAARRGTARAALLTADSRSLARAVNSNSGLWCQTDLVQVNVGGLRAVVGVLQRTEKAWTRRMKKNKKVKSSGVVAEETRDQQNPVVTDSPQ